MGLFRVGKVLLELVEGGDEVEGGRLGGEGALCLVPHYGVDIVSDEAFEWEQLSGLGEDGGISTTVIEQGVEVVFGQMRGPEQFVLEGLSHLCVVAADIVDGSRCDGAEGEFASEHGGVVVGCCGAKNLQQCRVGAF